MTKACQSLAISMGMESRDSWENGKTQNVAPEKVKPSCRTIAGKAEGYWGSEILNKEDIFAEGAQ